MRGGIYIGRRENMVVFVCRLVWSAAGSSWSSLQILTWSIPSASGCLVKIDWSWLETEAKWKYFSHLRFMIVNLSLIQPSPGLPPFKFSTKTWWILWQFWSLLREILEKSCLRLGRRNEKETRLHCLSEHLSSPTAPINLSMMSCRISIDFVMCIL